MAKISLEKAKQLQQKLGEAPPSWATPGEQFDKWVQQWAQGGLDSGDYRFTSAVGGHQAEGTSAKEDVITDWQDAAPSSEWMGKRNPTPAELRKWAHETGQSEDYERYADRQLSAWIKSNWKGDHFENDFGDRVEKPTESGPQSNAAGSATGMKNAGGGPGGGGGAGGGGGKGGGGATKPPGVSQGTPGQLSTTGNALQDSLINMFNRRGGIMNKNATGVYGAENNPLQGVSLSGGGMMWGNDLVNALKNKPTVDQSAPGAQTPVAGGSITAPSITRSVGGSSRTVAGPGPNGALFNAPGGAAGPSASNPLVSTLNNQAQGSSSPAGFAGAAVTNPATPPPTQAATAPVQAPQMLQPPATSNPLVPVLKKQVQGSIPQLPGGNRWWL